MPHIHFDEIDSTNAYAKAHCEELEDFTFVSASFQSAGKGRNERVWTASQNENLLFSLLLKDEKYIACGPFLTLVAAYAVSSFLEERYGLKTSIKWPNDVYINGRKVAGILLEGIANRCLVIGIGINVNQTLFQGEYRIPPTSLAIELEHPVDLSSFQEGMFASLSDSLRHVEDKQHFLTYFRERDYLLGKDVRYKGSAYLAKGVDDDFSLLLEKDGKAIPVISGEIDLR